MVKRLGTLIVIALLAAIALPITTTTANEASAASCGVLAEDTNFYDESITVGPFSVKAGDTMVVSWADVESNSTQTRNDYDIYYGNQISLAENYDSPAVGSASYTFTQDYDDIYVYFDSDIGDDELASYRVELLCGEVPGCDTTVNIPSSAVGASLVAETAVYWAPGKASNEVFPSGLHVRAIGVDESGMYTQVLFVCGFYWVPTDTIGPNYDAPWNGAPLPTVVVD